MATVTAVTAVAPVTAVAAVLREGEKVFLGKDLEKLPLVRVIAPG